MTMIRVFNTHFNMKFHQRGNVPAVVRFYSWNPLGADTDYKSNSDVKQPAFRTNSTFPNEVLWIYQLASYSKILSTINLFL